MIESKFQTPKFISGARLSVIYKLLFCGCSCCVRVYIPPTAKVYTRTGLRFQVLTERMSKPWIDLTTPGLQGEQLYHCTTYSAVLFDFDLFISCRKEKQLTNVMRQGGSVKCSFQCTERLSSEGLVIQHHIFG